MLTMSIFQLTGVSNDKVRKAVRWDMAAFRYQPTVQPLPKLRAWVAELERLLDINEGKRRRTTGCRGADVRALAGIAL